MSNEIGVYIAERARYYAESDILGYDQGNREGSDETDCSQLYARCVDEALRHYGFPGINTSAYSGNIVGVCRNAGATIFHYDGNPYDLEPGDALVEEGVHVVIGLGGGEIAQASIDENGNISGGAGGDQTGDEVNVSPAYPANWDYCISWTDFEVGSNQVQPEPDPVEQGFSREDGFTAEGVEYEVATSDGWLGSVTICNDNEAGYAGWKEKGIKAVRARRLDGAPLVIQVEMTNGAVLDPTTFTGSLFGGNNQGDGYAGDIDGDIYVKSITVQGANIRGAVKNGPWMDGDLFGCVSGSYEKPLVAIQLYC